MKRTEIAKLYECAENYSEGIVTVCGWIRTNRDSKVLGFMEINDGSCFKGVQVVFEKEKLDNFSEVAKYNVGAAVIVEGNLILTPEAKQPFEINATKVTLEGASAPEYPLQKKRHSLEYLRTIAHLRPRTNIYSASSEYVLLPHRQYTDFSNRKALYMHILLLFPAVTVRAQGRCSE